MGLEEGSRKTGQMPSSAGQAGSGGQKWGQDWGLGCPVESSPWDLPTLSAHGKWTQSEAWLGSVSLCPVSPWLPEAGTQAVPQLNDPGLGSLLV